MTRSVGDFMLGGGDASGNSGLEPDAGKLARPVPRRGGGSNATFLSDKTNTFIRFWNDFFFLI